VIGGADAVNKPTGACFDDPAEPGLMADEDLLQSWKEIGAYLGRSERTCRRWETEFRLPVHRMDGSPRGSVFAYKSELDNWMSEILHEEEEPPSIESRPRSAKNLTIIVALAAIVAVAAAVVLLRIGRSEPENPPSSDNPTLAILPFTNNTGDESLDFWEHALADLLVSDLSQSRYLTVLPQDKVFLFLRNLDLLDAGGSEAIDLEKVAARARVENIVVGSFIKAGQRFRISATVRHIPSGEAVVLPSVEARSQEEILIKVDNLSTRIKNQLLPPGDFTGRDIDPDPRSIRTSSIEAYRYYIDGKMSLCDGRAAEAVESLEMAVAIDPEFAMAYRKLATCYRSLSGHEDKAEEALLRAFELSHHASLRERFYIQAYYYRTRGPRAWGQYLETSREFVRIYPDDPQAALHLGEAYLRLEEWEKSIETLESIIDEYFSRNRFDYMQRAYCAQGMYEEALAVAEAAPAERYPFQYPYQLALNMIYDRRFEAALLEADKMLEHSPGHISALMVKGDVHFYRAEWDQAEEYYRELLNPVGTDYRRVRSRRDAMIRLANLYLAKGQFERALDILGQAIDEITVLGDRRSLSFFHGIKAHILFAQGDLSEANAEIQTEMEQLERRNPVIGEIAKLSALHNHGRILLEMGNVGGAERAADEMKAAIDGWLNPKLIRVWHHLAGHIDLARNDVVGAVEHFERAIALVPHQFNPDGDNHAEFYSSLAYAYYLSGDLARAQEWYENTLSLTSGRLWFGQIYAKSHFMLGQIYEQRGMDAEAILSYRTFLDLWREADVQTAELGEARESLATLLK
jgi:tetratricopeptide (TPR) repeat protein